jgi:amino-acid N-acetyltransferase
MRYSLRPATAVDQPAIKSLIRAVRINSFGLDWRHFIVAINGDGRLIGCGQIKAHGDGSRELASIAVTRQWRGQGVARAIIERLLSTAVPPLWLICVSTNVPLYEKFDFHEVRQPAAMPPYFRRLRLLGRPFLWFSRSSDYLAIMCWQGETEAAVQES